MLTAFSNQNLFHKLLGNGHNFTILTGGHWAHNDYIEILCTYGVVGLICYLKAVFNVFNRILHKANVTVIAWVISIFIWAFNAFFNMFYTYLCAELALPFMLLALRYKYINSEGETEE
jgi:O-antigen ligase